MDNFYEFPVDYIVQDCYTLINKEKLMNSNDFKLMMITMATIAKQLKRIADALEGEQNESR